MSVICAGTADRDGREGDGRHQYRLRSLLRSQGLCHLSQYRSERLQSHHGGIIRVRGHTASALFRRRLLASRRKETEGEVSGVNHLLQDVHAQHGDVGAPGRVLLGDVVPVQAVHAERAVHHAVYQ